MRWRRVCAKKQFGDQAEDANTSREVSAAKIASSPGDLKCVTGQVPIGAEETTGPLPEIGNDHDVSLIISRAGFNPCLPLAHVVGRSQICVPIAASDFQPTEFVDQKEID